MDNEAEKVNFNPNGIDSNYDEKVHFITQFPPQGTNNNKTESTIISIEINSSTTSFDLFKGIFFMLISCIFKSIYSIIIKIIINRNPLLNPFVILSYRTYTILWICAFYILVFNVKLIPTKDQLKKLHLVIIRAFFTILISTLIFFSLKNMNISDVYSIFYIYPAITILLSVIFFKEKAGLMDYTCLLTCVIGVIFIVRPSFIFGSLSMGSNSQNEFFIFVLISAIAKSIEDLCVRNAGKDFNPFFFIFIDTIIGMVYYPMPIMISELEMHPLAELDMILIISLGILLFVYTYFLVLGLQNETAGRVSMINYFQVGLMYISDILIFHKPLIVLDLIGTSLIFGFNFANGLYKTITRENKLKEYNTRNYYKN